MAKKIHVTQLEMERAFVRHRAWVRQAALNGAEASQHLLLCYAVECGLKARVMKEQLVDDTKVLDEQRLLHHNLREYIKKLKVPAALPLRNGTPQVTPPCRANHTFVGADRYHEAFRYGIDLKNEAEVVDELQAVLAHLGALP